MNAYSLGDRAQRSFENLGEIKNKKITAMAERVIALGGYHRCTEDVV